MKEQTEDKKQLIIYIKAFNIMMDYFNELSIESRLEIDEKLKEIGL